MTTQFESITVGSLAVRHLRDGSIDGTVGLFEVTIFPNATALPPPHKHANNDESVYVLEGSLNYSVDGETRVLNAGETMYSPRGSVHSFSSANGNLVRVLFVQNPDLGPGYFRDIATVLTAGGPPDREKLMAVMGKYGLVAGGPAPTNVG